MEYRYWFASLTGIGNASKLALIDYFNDPARIFSASKEALISSGILDDDISEYIIQQRKQWRLTECYNDFLVKDISLVTYDMEDFPESLKYIHNCPYAIYYRGTLPARDERIIAMVGARTPSQYGRMMAERIAATLSNANYSICSGMALGIDGVAHRGALKEGGRTYAYLGCGVDIVYPKRHEGLYDEIIKNGAVLSDYEPGKEPLAVHFPSRNRLISGMSDKTIVIEARAKSGSLITADFAAEQGKDVYVLPGRVTDPLSEGCLSLIAQGASVITSVEGLLRDFNELKYLDTVENKNLSGENYKLEKDELLVYSCFDFYAKGVEEIQNECGLELIRLFSIIMKLCEYGLIRETFKNHYIRLG